MAEEPRVNERGGIRRGMGAGAMAALRARLIGCSCSSIIRDHDRECGCVCGCSCIGQQQYRRQKPGLVVVVSTSNARIFPEKPARLKSPSSGSSVPSQRGETMAESTSANSYQTDDFWGDSRWFNGKPKLVVVGHRGCGKNKTASAGEAPDPKPSIRENTITSFNMAAANGTDYVEFDVQVTKDGHAVIFHDDLIITDDNVARSIGDLTLEEFLSIGFQKDGRQGGKRLLRRANDGSLRPWVANVEDSLCTLRQAFEQVYPFVGFNIELKFHDVNPTSDEEMERVISAVISDVNEYANGRRIYFSSFHPDAVDLLRKRQQLYPVFFLTDGGVHVYSDPRRNSIEAAIEVCKKSNLQGIVSEVKAILHNANAVAQVKEAGFYFLTYGELNNVAEAVHKQEEFGVDGVIVDHVLEMVTVARKLDNFFSASPSTGLEPSPAVKAVA